MSFDQLLPYSPLIVGVLGLTGILINLAYKHFIGNPKEKIRNLELQYATSQAAVSEHAKQLASVTSARDHFERKSAELESLNTAHDQLAVDHVQSQSEIDLLRKESIGFNNRVRKALQLEGAIWTQPIMAGTFPFRPLAERQTPIVSVLNLKGGVGKTTLTAYLGWALAARGYRVLLVDLDLQGSLSSFFVENSQLRKMEDCGSLLRHYMDASSNGDSKVKLLDFATPIPQLNERSKIVATTDKLAYSEMGQTFQWLLRVGIPSQKWNGRRDGRMILRRALHAKSVTSKFDVVLLDCPPIVNLCCANALAASDFLLLPVTPNVKAIERVAPLLNRLVEIKARGVNPALNLLGIVVNRHQQEDLVPKEQDLLKDLPQACYDVLKTDAYIFDTTVPQRSQFRDAEDSFTPPDPGSKICKVFEAMAEEFIKRLPNQCRRPNTDRVRRAVGVIGGGGL